MKITMKNELLILKENLKERYDSIVLNDSTLEDLVQKSHVYSKIKEAEDNTFKIPKILQHQGRLVPNYCNYFTFMTGAVPLLYEDSNITLNDFFSAFSTTSALGLNCLFKHNGKEYFTNYSPSLSSIEMYSKPKMNFQKESQNDFYTQTSLFSSFTGSKNKRFNFNTKIAQIMGPYQGSYSTQDSLSLSSLMHNKSSFSTENDFKSSQILSYHEDLPHHKRQVFIETIENLISDNKNQKLSEISEQSWFSILWTPMKTTLPTNSKQNTNFLIFYRFFTEKNSNSKEKIGFLKVAGVRAIGMEDEYFWFSNNTPLFDIHSLKDNLVFNKLSEDYLENRSKFKESTKEAKAFIEKQNVNESLDCSLVDR